MAERRAACAPEHRPPDGRAWFGRSGARMLRTRPTIAVRGFVNALERSVVVDPARPDFDDPLLGTIRPLVFGRRPVRP